MGQSSISMLHALVPYYWLERLTESQRNELERRIQKMDRMCGTRGARFWTRASNESEPLLQLLVEFEYWAPNGLGKKPRVTCSLGGDLRHPTIQESVELTGYDSSRRSQQCLVAELKRICAILSPGAFASHRAVRRIRRVTA